MTAGYFNPVEVLDTSPPVSDEVKYTTCGMCAGRCGIKVHLLDGNIRHIEGDPDHPVNRGVLCAKGAAGVMNHYSPARLTKPLKRVGERGRGEFQEIEWDEALSLAAGWLGDIRLNDPSRLAFFTGSDQSQALTEWWAGQFGTPNYAAHGGYCSVNMAAAGLYTIGGSFWEFGEPDWALAKYFLMFGVAEDHNSNPMKAGLAKLRANGAKFVSVNPIKTGYSAIADEWLGIRPGTDGIFVLALVHELLKADRIDLDYIVRYTNLTWLVIQDPDGAEDGLFARGEDGAPLCWDGAAGEIANALRVGITPALSGEHLLPDGRRAIPAFELMARRYLDDAYSPAVAARETNISAATIRRIAAELAEAAFEREIELDQPWTDWAGRRHPTTRGRPVAMHAMRGISAHSNGFHTCRAIHLLQILLGSIDCPGGFRYRPPFPKTAPPPMRPAGKAGEVAPDTPLSGLPLGFPTGPGDLLVEADGAPRRIDKAFSWEAPVAPHGMMHMAIRNAFDRDPYPIDLLFIHMSNMGWNSSMNAAGTMDMLTAKDPSSGEYRIPKIVCSDTFFSEVTAFADLVLPDASYLERWDCLSLIDRPVGTADGPADAVRQPIEPPGGDVRPFQDTLLDLGVRIGLPGLINQDGSARYPGGYADYLVNHERSPGVGLLAGWRGAQGNLALTGPPNPKQLEQYVRNGGFWSQALAPSQRYYKHANRDYLEFAAKAGFVDDAAQIILQPYCEPLQRFRLAARGHGTVQPPDHHRQRIETYFDPLPIWYPPFEGAAIDSREYSLHALTQRPMAMYSGGGSQNAWLRQIHGTNPLYINRRAADRLEIEDGDWVWVISHHGRLRARVKFMEGVNLDTVWTWNAVGKRPGAWNLDPEAPEARTGFLLNHVISELLPGQPDGHRYANADPVTGQAAWYDLRVRIEKCDPDDEALTEPRFDPVSPPAGLPQRPPVLRYGRVFSKMDREETDG